MSLTSPTQPGSAVIAAVHSQNAPSLITSDGFAQVGPDVVSGASGHLTLLLRPDVAAGEQNYTLNTLTTSMTNWALFEFARMDMASPLDQYSVGGSAATDSVSTNTTPATSSDDEIIVAVHAVGGSLASGVTPTSPTNGFIVYESHSQVASTFLSFIVSLLFPAAAGTFESTATLSPAASGAPAVGVAYCLRAAGDLPVPPVGPAVMIG